MIRKTEVLWIERLPKPYPKGARRWLEIVQDFWCHPTKGWRKSGPKRQRVAYRWHMHSATLGYDGQ